VDKVWNDIVNGKRVWGTVRAFGGLQRPGVCGERYLRMIRGEGGLLDLNRICGLEQERNTKVQ
jgi:hypothetical protein